MGLGTILLQIVVVIIAIQLFKAIMTFFGIEISTYASYLAWFIAIFIFFKIFSGKRKSILD